MSNRLKKKAKKRRPFDEWASFQNMSKDEWYNYLEEKKEKARRRRMRRAPYKQKPLASVRGIRIVRGSHWGGGCNGELCLCCLSVRGFTQKEDGLRWSPTRNANATCDNCGSDSVIWLNSKDRRPRKCASKANWKQFLKYLKYPVPEDFMKEVKG